MSVESSPNPESQLPPSVENIKRYAKDICNVNNYPSLLIDTKRLLTDQFGYSSQHAEDLLRLQQTEGIFPTESDFDKDPADAMDKARFYLYGFVLPHFEVSSQVQGGAEANTYLGEYAGWVNWTLAGISQGSENRHSSEDCTTLNDGLNNIHCQEGLPCPLRFAIADVVDEVDRFTVEDDIAILANDLDSKVGGYVINEYARLKLKLRYLQLHKLISSKAYNYKCLEILAAKETMLDNVRRILPGITGDSSSSNTESDDK